MPGMLEYGVMHDDALYRIFFRILTGVLQKDGS